jgi:hypothetical protein
MDLFVKIVVSVLVLVALWFAFQPRFLFLVRIRDGVLYVSKGKVIAAFLESIREVCTEHGIRRGWVGGIALGRGKKVRLVFSRSIPEGCRQRLRNLWLLQG